MLPGFYIALAMNKYVIIYSYRTHKIIRVLIGHTETIQQLALRCGMNLLSCGLDNRIISWNAITGRMLMVLVGRNIKKNFFDSIHSMLLLMRDILISGNRDGTLQIWKITARSAQQIMQPSSLEGSAPRSTGETQEGESIVTLQGHDNCVTNIKYISDMYFISSCKGGELKIWRSYTWEIIRCLTFGWGEINQLCVIDQSVLALSNSSGVTKFVNWQESGDNMRYKQLFQLKKESNAKMHYFDISDDTENDEPVEQPQSPPAEILGLIKITPHHIATYGSDKVITVWH